MGAVGRAVAGPGEWGGRESQRRWPGDRGHTEPTVTAQRREAGRRVWGGRQKGPGWWQGRVWGSVSLETCRLPRACPARPCRLRAPARPLCEPQKRRPVTGGNKMGAHEGSREADRGTGEEKCLHQNLRGPGLGTPGRRARGQARLGTDRTGRDGGRGGPSSRGPVQGLCSSPGRTEGE